MNYLQNEWMRDFRIYIYVDLLLVSNLFPEEMNSLKFYLNLKSAYIWNMHPSTKKTRAFDCILSTTLTDEYCYIANRWEVIHFVYHGHTDGRSVLNYITVAVSGEIHRHSLDDQYVNSIAFKYKKIHEYTSCRIQCVV